MRRYDLTIILDISEKSGTVSRQTSVDSRGRASVSSTQGGTDVRTRGSTSSLQGLGQQTLDGPSPPMMKVIAQLWCHECTRTFADRLVTEEGKLLSDGS